VVSGPLELDGLTRRYGALTVLGVTELDSGTVRWNGAPVGQNERRRFGYMPEEQGLYPAMLVGEQLDTSADCTG
jgi:ABC-type uncharacterized transport system ATPase subunit